MATQDLKTIDFSNVEEVKRQLSARRIIRSRFSLDLDVDTCARALHAAVCVEIGRRGANPDMPDSMKDCIMQGARWLINPAGKPGLLLMGLYGNGKTTLARAISALVELYTEQRQGYNRGLLFRNCLAKEIANLLLDRSTRKDYQELTTAPALIIDDLGEEATEVIDYGMKFYPIIDLLTARYDAQRPTIITTNLTISEIETKYGARVRDRFREMMQPIIFRHPSFRK